MLRSSSLALLLICASASALAQDRRLPVADACLSDETLVREPADASAAPAPRSSAARSKYARKAGSAPSGGGSDEVLPRARGSKWHNFLPGMFR